MPDDRRLYIFDLDGTLVQTRSGNKFRRTPDDWAFIPGRIEAIQKLAREGHEVAVATNQGGAAFDYFDPVEMMRELRQTLGLLFSGTAMVLDADRRLAVCWTHPNASLPWLRVEDDPRRKPNPGMLQELIHRFAMKRGQTFAIGDRGEDVAAAQAAGATFIGVESFFGGDGQENRPREEAAPSLEF
jgi:D-glycero-D-manno-heptose 1,7-bisphosphate phosphatase